MSLDRTDNKAEGNPMYTETHLISLPNSQKDGEEEENTDGKLGLPLPDHEGESRIHRLEVGSSVSMDHLGPIIINTDGTTRRISNWDTMTKSEQENAIRLISARNKRRIEALKSAREET
eukprot:CAMPEP_0202961604 /NCGR_PEP_ID=MMETSP1396-20130829/5677_1 /ASSEMBLY_ACC=CAM_ASM_000872 /TAXON_ID= /ORGANISM="Pseudokeronopsis sp., Strain Brazil" /LENGTH=118 /DNA_ID=CAMNT_0049681569 /DNA_START=160 /DNA_END=519 /DNA_ORIENTATION=+